MYKKILLIILIIFIILAIGYFIFKNISFVNDDILESASSLTNPSTQIKPDVIDNVNIYLVNNISKDIERESRTISLNELNTNPYIILLNELKKESQNSDLLNPIPTNTKILSATLNKSTLVIDMSIEFINQDVSNELDMLILKSITKTMTNLKEVRNIKINIDGNDNSKLGTYELSSTFTNTSF